MSKSTPSIVLTKLVKIWIEEQLCWSTSVFSRSRKPGSEMRFASWLAATSSTVPSPAIAWEGQVPMTLVLLAFYLAASATDILSAKDVLQRTTQLRSFPLVDYLNSCKIVAIYLRRWQFLKAPGASTMRYRASASINRYSIPPLLAQLRQAKNSWRHAVYRVKIHFTL